MTTETLETECTTEIELQTPEDKTPVTTTASTHEEKTVKKPVDFIQKTLSQKVQMNQQHHNFHKICRRFNFHNHTGDITNKETLETECTTEINLSTTGDKTPVTTTATIYEENRQNLFDFISETLSQKVQMNQQHQLLSIKYCRRFHFNQRSDINDNRDS